jgi:hypothetical protein
MLTREELISREKMASTGGFSQDEKEFINSVFVHGRDGESVV